jgi:hypothetical protein
MTARIYFAIEDFVSTANKIVFDNLINVIKANVHYSDLTALINVLRVYEYYLLKILIFINYKLVATN